MIRSNTPMLTTTPPPPSPTIDIDNDDIKMIEKLENILVQNTYRFTVDSLYTKGSHYPCFVCSSSNQSRMNKIMFDPNGKRQCNLCQTKVQQMYYCDCCDWAGCLLCLCK